jgi:RHS repeat-associated protein
VKTFLGRLTAHTDQLGTTTYSYIPFTGTQNGAGDLYEIDGPWSNDSFRHSYDWQGRRVSRQMLDDTMPVANILHEQQISFDALGRITGETNNLGAFTLTYDPGNLTEKVDQLLYPNGMQTEYEYYPVTGSTNDSRLKEIHNKLNGGATLSKFGYGFDSLGRIQQWTQQQGALASDQEDHLFSYDKTSQLTDAVIKDDSGTVLNTLSWQYDQAGNRIRESEGLGSTYTQHNDVNQLTQIGGAGVTLIEGVVDEPALVTVNGEAANVVSQPGGDYLFRREIPLAEGSNTVTIEATDASNNTATQSYSIVVGGVQKILEYDLNGNLRFEKDDQEAVLREFQWDAVNRLVKIIEGTHTSEFTYDALDRRVRIVEKESGVEQSNSTYVWADGGIVQKRDAAAATVLRNYFSDGFTEGANAYFYAKDHLGSIREVVADDGMTTESRYEYSAWGEFTKIGGSGVESDFLYTGHLHHDPSDLFLAHYRAYSPEFGRWLSRDPIGEAEYLNLYTYVFNNPVNWIDPDGRCAAAVGATAKAVAKTIVARALKNAAVGAAVGAVSGGTSGFVANADAQSGSDLAKGVAKSAFAGGVGGGVGGFLTGFGEHPALDAFGGYAGAKTANSISNALSGSKISENQKKLQRVQEYSTGACAGAPLTDTGDAIAVGLSTGIFSSLINKLSEKVENIED